MGLSGAFEIGVRTPIDPDLQNQCVYDLDVIELLVGISCAGAALAGKALQHRQAKRASQP